MLDWLSKIEMHRRSEVKPDLRAQISSLTSFLIEARTSYLSAPGTTQGVLRKYEMLFTGLFSNDPMSVSPWSVPVNVSIFRPDS